MALAAVPVIPKTQREKSEVASVPGSRKVVPGVPIEGEEEGDLEGDRETEEEGEGEILGEGAEGSRAKAAEAPCLLVWAQVNAPVLPEVVFIAEAKATSQSFPPVEVASNCSVKEDGSVAAWLVIASVSFPVLATTRKTIEFATPTFICAWVSLPDALASGTAVVKEKGLATPEAPE